MFGKQQELENHQLSLMSNTNSQEHVHAQNDEFPVILQALKTQNENKNALVCSEDENKDNSNDIDPTTLKWYQFPSIGKQNWIMLLIVLLINAPVLTVNVSVIVYHMYIFDISIKSTNIDLFITFNININDK